jgi:hypothetical protein
VQSTDLRYFKTSPRKLFVFEFAQKSHLNKRKGHTDTDVQCILAPKRACGQCFASGLIDSGSSIIGRIPIRIWWPPITAKKIYMLYNTQLKFDNTSHAVLRRNASRKPPSADFNSIYSRTCSEGGGNWSNVKGEKAEPFFTNYFYYFISRLIPTYVAVATCEVAAYITWHEHKRRRWESKGHDEQQYKG